MQFEKSVAKFTAHCRVRLSLPWIDGFNSIDDYILSRQSNNLIKQKDPPHSYIEKKIVRGTWFCCYSALHRCTLLIYLQFRGICIIKINAFDHSIICINKAFLRKWEWKKKWIIIINIIIQHTSRFCEILVMFLPTNVVAFATYVIFLCVLYVCISAYSFWLGHN